MFLAGPTGIYPMISRVYLITCGNDEELSTKDRPR